MFHLLRKLVLLVFFALLADAGVFLYQKRSALDPVIDYYEAWQISREDPPRKARDSLSGEVTRVTGEYSFQMKGDQGPVFNFQLTGFEPMGHRKSADHNESNLKEKAKARLGQLLLSNHVHVTVTYLSERRIGLGVVYLGETNVNAALLEDGLARLNRNYLKGLTRDALYQMFRAERKAKEQKRGVWKE